jgi:hypothetical protein
VGISLEPPLNMSIRGLGNRVHIIFFESYIILGFVTAQSKGVRIY